MTISNVYPQSVSKLIEYIFNNNPLNYQQQLHYRPFLYPSNYHFITQMLLKGKHKDTIERYKNNKFRKSIDKYYNISQFADSILTDAQNYIMVYDLNGRFVETLVNSNQQRQTLVQLNEMQNIY